MIFSIWPSRGWSYCPPCDWWSNMGGRGYHLLQYTALFSVERVFALPFCWSSIRSSITGDGDGVQLSPILSPPVDCLHVSCHRQGQLQRWIEYQPLMMMMRIRIRVTTMTLGCAPFTYHPLYLQVVGRFSSSLLVLNRSNWPEWPCNKFFLEFGQRMKLSS